MDRRSRKVYWLWGIALTLLVITGAFCWLIAAPIIRARAVLHQEETLGGDWVNGEVEPGVWRSAVDRLGGPRPAGSVLRLYLRLPENIAERKHRAVIVLGHCGPDYLDEVLRRAESDEPATRGAAVTGLSAHRSPAATETCVRLLRDPNSCVRKLAALALGEQGTPKAIEELISALRDKDRAHKELAHQGLERVGLKAQPRLLALMKDKAVDDDTCSWAAELLGKVGDAKAVSALAGLHKTRPGPPARTGVRALGRIGTPEARDALIDLLAARSDPFLSVHVAIALGDVGKSACPQLIKNLSDTDPHKRRIAAKALGMIGPEAKTAVPALEGALKDKDRMVRQAATEALAKIQRAGGGEKPGGKP